MSDPNNFKFIDIVVMVDLSHNVYSRQTYDLLMFLGDIGGLQGTLKLIG